MNPSLGENKNALGLARSEVCLSSVDGHAFWIMTAGDLFIMAFAFFLTISRLRKDNLYSAMIPLKS